MKLMKSFKFILGVVFVAMLYGLKVYTAIMLQVFFMLLLVFMAFGIIWRKCFPNWNPRGYFERRKERKVTYNTGDRVRVVVWPWLGEIGTLLHTDSENVFDWLVGLDMGKTVSFDQEEIEPLHWWKFWRSKTN